MLHTTGADGVDHEPTDTELATIEAEQPLIRAQVDLLDVQIALMDRPLLHPLDVRRLRRAERRVLAARARLAARSDQDQGVSA